MVLSARTSGAVSPLRPIRWGRTRRPSLAEALLIRTASTATFLPYGVHVGFIRSSRIAPGRVLGRVCAIERGIHTGERPMAVTWRLWKEMSTGLYLRAAIAVWCRPMSDGVARRRRRCRICRVSLRIIEAGSWTYDGTPLKVA